MALFNLREDEMSFLQEGLCTNLREEREFNQASVNCQVCHSVCATGCGANCSGGCGGNK
jgi:hypothetical protein